MSGECDKPGATLDGVKPQGKWHEMDPRHAFVMGAKWWEWKQNGATMFPSDVNAAEDIAERRYTAALSATATEDKEFCPECGKPPGQACELKFLKDLCPRLSAMPSHEGTNYAATARALADENPNTSSEHARERLDAPAGAAPTPRTEAARDRGNTEAEQIKELTIEARKLERELEDERGYLISCPWCSEYMDKRPISAQMMHVISCGDRRIGEESARSSTAPTAEAVRARFDEILRDYRGHGDGAWAAARWYAESLVRSATLANDEPVCWVHKDAAMLKQGKRHHPDCDVNYIPLYAAPQATMKAGPPASSNELAAAAPNLCTCYVLPHEDDCGIFVGITQAGVRVEERRSGEDRRTVPSPTNDAFKSRRSST